MAKQPAAGQGRSAYNLRSRKTSAEKEAEKKREDEERAAAALRQKEKKEQQKKERPAKAVVKQSAKATATEGEKTAPAKTKKTAPAKGKKKAPAKSQKAAPAEGEKTAPAKRQKKAPAKKPVAPKGTAANAPANAEQQSAAPANVAGAGAADSAPGWPSTISHAKKSRGMTNPNTLCYRNSTLQVLLHLPPFLALLLEHHKKEQCSIQNVKTCFPCAMRGLMDTFWHRDVNLNYRLNGIMVAGRHHIASQAQHWDEQGQQDAQEYLLWMFGVMRQQLPHGDSELSELNRLFRIGFLDTRTCRTCGTPKPPNRRRELELALNFPPTPGPHVLGDLVRSAFQPDELPGVHCPTCQQNRDHDSRPQVEQAPPLLVVRLNRTRFNVQTGQAEKITDEVNCLNDVDLGPSLIGDAQGEARYELRGFISHAAVHPQSLKKLDRPQEVSIHSGHYRAAAVEPDGSWTILDDVRIYHNLTKQQAFSWERARDGTPYVLIFMRRGADEAVEEAALATASKAGGAGAAGSKATATAGKSTRAGQRAEAYKVPTAPGTQNGQGEAAPVGQAHASGAGPTDVEASQKRKRTAADDEGSGEPAKKAKKVAGEGGDDGDEVVVIKDGNDDDEVVVVEDGDDDDDEVVVVEDEDAESWGTTPRPFPDKFAPVPKPEMEPAPANENRTARYARVRRHRAAMERWEALDRARINAMADWLAAERYRMAQAERAARTAQNPGAGKTTKKKKRRTHWAEGKLVVELSSD